ncbi:LacI family DNA-binding transcriptional regulator [Phaeobacter porticola]|uniref:Putative transcriptional regulator, lacI family n=1 Tax=Phaeobacter porticola TaxID=1844006 RepID=A0A1L3I3Q3_9RHOB|nr:LacI family DNA-binding transcriptional regulator [Phaeobacter porticola]APG46743.1 putative transcriptional regulator, lacI family [Phaeobacter porticola]
MSEPKIKNMDEFASVSGISRPTLSKYFNNPDSVRKSTRERIEEALEKFDYRPNLYAMNQNRRLTKTIGIVVPNLTDPFFVKIARHIEDHVIAAGYRPVLLGSHGTQEQELENLNNLRLLKPAGALLAPLGRVSDKPQIQQFCDEVPTVLFDANIEDIGEAFIGSNNQQSITTVVEYLCRTGDAPAFFEMKTPTNPNAVKRRTAYISSMERLGHLPQLIQVDGDGWDFEEIGFREGTRLLSERHLKTDTILCSNDRLAIGLLSAAYQQGLRVGLGDGCALRVAGHDDHPFSRYTCPTLTTVSQDYSAIAQTSAETLVARIESNRALDSRREILFDGKLVMRGSA